MSNHAGRSNQVKGNFHRWIGGFWQLITCFWQSRSAKIKLAGFLEAHEGEVSVSHAI
jgi:hypothetical protein